MKKYQEYLVACSTLGLGVLLATAFAPIADGDGDRAGASSSQQMESDSERANAENPSIEGRRADVTKEFRDRIIYESETTEVVVPLNSIDPLVLASDNGRRFEVVLLEEPADTKVSVGREAASVRSSADFGTVTNVLSDGSVQINVVIENSSAPTRYTFDLGLSRSDDLKIADDGSVVINDGTGEFILGIAPPWALDRNGVAVPSHFELEGRNVVQVVNHVNPAWEYPVVADPWLGNRLISRVSWVYITGSAWDPTLKVYPTTWGRYWAPIAARSAAWTEVKSLHSALPSQAQLATANTATMRDQFYCHWDIVRLRTPNKESWNLDSKRPNVGYISNVKQDCNPT